MHSGSTFKKSKKVKKRSTFTCIKSLNRYNLRHNNCVIFSIFLYFKYSFLFVHWKKSYQLLICRVAKNLPVLELLTHFIKSSTIAYKRVAYKKNLVECRHNSCQHEIIPVLYSKVSLLVNLFCFLLEKKSSIHMIKQPSKCFEM